MIKRDMYLELLKKREWDGNIKVIKGIRICGKSVLLFELFKDYLLSNGAKEENIIEIKLDRMEDIQLRNPFLLYKKVSNIVNNSDEKFYLFIDEIQMSVKKKDRKSGITDHI